MLVPYLLICLLLSISSAMGLQRLTPGNSMAVEDSNQFLVSPNGTFSSGFYRVGNNSYCFSIWFTNSFDKTVVWMANRDKPVNGEQSRLTLNVDSNLVLTDADGFVVWSTDAVSDGYVELRLLESGNLVVTNGTENFIWQSFDFPTDTLLPGQRFLKTSTLISMRSLGTYLTGFYYFKFNDENVLNLLYNGPSLSSIYWPYTLVLVFQIGRTTYNSSRIAILDEMGGFESSDKFKFNATDYGIGPKRRLTMDYDGILRLYSLDESTGNWTISWLPDGQLDACMVHGLCGDYGICEYSPFPTCTCPPGFTRNDPSDWTKGCKPPYNLTCDSKEVDFIPLPNTDYFGYDWSYASFVSFEVCRNICLSCECAGFGYALDGSGQCYPKTALRNGYRKPDVAVNMFIKAPKGAVGRSEDEFMAVGNSNDLNCSASELVMNTHVYGGESNKFRYMGLLIGVVVTVGASELVFVGFGWWFVFRKRVREELVNMGYIVLAMGFKRFSYAELKRATKNFKQEIGNGGFGTVFKGELDDGRVVAVKRLEGVIQGEAEFWAEVSIIGKINHRNLVKLWGFCAEKQHKMLVYEYVKNGSLDKLLFSDSTDQSLGLEQRYEIAVGTAKGLSYLHEECLEWVLHCDVKPQNILLDEALEPKVADFGMSKLFQEINETGFSKVRGTRGYLAPEWMMNLKVDAKVDVYSYGIVLLELVSGKNASNFRSSTIVEDSGCTDLVKWITKSVEKDEVKKVIDPRLNMEEEDQNKIKKIEILLNVALQCVRDDRNTRPAMSKVVELLTSYEESSPHSEDD